MGEAKVYDENLNEINIKSSSIKKDSNTPNSTEKKRKRATQYITDSKKRVDCRFKRRSGVVKDLRNLKISTHDDAYIEFIRYNNMNE